ncbi:MAG TPA: transcriptional repressor [Candidatus Aminicenantes bacterium]|nr:transcriptional repressor [Candidatus Aminicenantes bacterium]
MKPDDKDSRHRAQQVLTNAGIKPSFQRLRILSFIMSAHVHPSAEEIFQTLRPEIPTLSRTTVYNTLNILVDRGLLLPLTISEHETRYDPNTRSDHSHFFCRHCERIFDIREIPACVAGQELDGHLVENVRLYLTGMCRDCRGKDSLD